LDAIELLKQDHRTVEALFKQYEAIGDRAVKSRKRVVEKIIRELAVHSAVEEMLFYPAVRAAAKLNDTRVNKAADELVLESLEEHHIVKWTLAALAKMEPDDERYDAKVKVLMESVRNHVREEESELFPKAMRMLRRQLDELGEQMARAKRLAPTRPHPRAPDEPPGNYIAAPMAAMADRARDLVSDLASRVTRRGERRGRPTRELDS
jgi:hemerythrin superfamily protein